MLMGSSLLSSYQTKLSDYHNHDIKIIMTRLGFDYFPDTLHYRQHDLNIWLPRLKSLGAQWLVLKAPLNIAIPEPFIAGLIKEGIQPVLQFDLQLGSFPVTADLPLMFSTYQRWGVRYVTLFDSPNLHKVWRAAAWVQTDLVERFLDIYLPLANACLNAGLTPIFPPLEPGGDYWDTAFLRAALQSIQRRGQHDLLDQLVMGAYARSGSHPIQWGAGGPERWPNARPYYTPEGVEDQRGFRIFDWYTAISQTVVSSSMPIFLFGMGYTSQVEGYLNRNLTIARLLADEFIDGYEPIPREVIGGAFGPLIDWQGSTDSIHGWFQPDGEARPQAEAIRQWAKKKSQNGEPAQTETRGIRHYLLLPSYEWGISDYHLDIIRPIIKKHQPTVGFSLEEASNARQVTVIGGEHAFTEESLNQLRGVGIIVHRVNEDGTDIASVLATL